ncbi:hypothetical protein rosmuc_02796 [Roseovarius mucosus DSM 17069]|uniref:Nucleotide kinase n=1 Tax=Roseovarius mucosus DSM 17069 TaxID=1288298 RepID=A0A0A0HIK1_9RHOB|nr:DUF2478 domain-containing protein [Roseovarius mucosus]KGM86509.1 hypothetical protein rosmuc_02796 [Roseovarius mucosus DSM 17069]
MTGDALACVASDARGGVNPVLWQVAHRLINDGLHIVGTVQRDSQGKGARQCNMGVLVLPHGPETRISQSLGAGARGCRLDPAGLEDAVSLTAQRLETGPVDLLIVNKFGKHEAEGRGFRWVIARAIELEIPVLVGLNRLNRQEFHEFVGVKVLQLPLDERAIANWSMSIVRSTSWIT